MTKGSIIFYDSGEGISIDYETLQVEVSKGGLIKTSSAYHNTSEFLLNFFRAIVHGVDITLVDPLHPLTSSKDQVMVDEIKMDTLENLREALINSVSKVTIFTSGTTGQPKKVIHSMKNLLREVRIHKRHEDAVWAFAYNPTHMAGIQVLLQAICNFNTIIDVFGKGKSEVLEAISTHKVTHISATPTFYRLLVPVNEPLQTVRSVSLGGEKSDAMLHSTIKLMFPNARIFNIYASTEAGTIFSSHGTNFVIKNNLLNKVKIENNELLIHKSLTGDYGAEKKDIWYSTGDTVEWIDKENRVFKFISRKNEMINVGGNKVNPHEVEEKIMAIPGVRGCFVFGKPNPLLGNMVCAEVVLSDNQVTEVIIKRSLRESLEAYQIPRKINIVPKLKTTRTGKLKRI